MPNLNITPISGDLLHGALDLEHGMHGIVPQRLHRAARILADQQLNMAQAQPSGVRLVFRTTATVVELDAHRTTLAYQGVAPRPDGCYDLLVDGELAGQVISTGGTPRSSISRLANVRPKLVRTRQSASPGSRSDRSASNLATAL